MGDDDASDLESLIATGALEVAEAVGAACATASRRHGHCPRAVDHVRLYLLCEVAGLTPATIARTDPRHRSVVYRSIERGRRLCERRRGLGGAEGFSRPDRD